MRDVTVDRPRRPRYLFRQLLLRQRPAKALEPRSMLGLLVENRLSARSRHGRQSITPGRSAAFENQCPPRPRLQLLTRRSRTTYHRLTASPAAEGGSRLEDLDVPPDALSRPAGRLREALPLRLGRPAFPRAVHA